jgi:PhoPQ-activated pathogenicity-related protein
MKRTFRAIRTCQCLVLALISAAALLQSSAKESKPLGMHARDGSPVTALDEYIAAPDANYSFHLVKTIPANDYTAYVLEMTSQAWLTTNEVDRPIWKHWVTIIKPKEITSSKSLLMITGGANGGEPPGQPDSNLGQIAVATKSVVAELKMVPNQPLVFKGEKQVRKEDSLIA